ncbi:hypothetical protein EXIGLDRAFT_839449 [Exidia glandulosa HHB12029]|uniref:C2 domain-containing protein n=1 Tax=Exidia glandulosa HHB12029 TaxID=1314781 RepID=A0A165F0N0_EXIGL|nr:hypothetical protein EXIGLDRAFT_839449 [Exidia glandulosa HHB12029]
MSAPTAYGVGQPYSENRPIPTIAKFEEHQREQQEEQKANVLPDAPNDNPGAKGGAEEKDAIMKRAMNKEPPPTQQVEEQRKKGPRTVKDPTTGQQVLIKDAKFQDYEGGALDHLAPEDDVGGPATRKPGGVSEKVTAPSPAMPGNILLHAFPEPTVVHLKPFLDNMDRVMYGIIAASSLIWIFTAFGHGLWHFAFVSGLVGAATFIELTLVSLVQRSIEKEFERVRHDMARRRGEEFSPPTPESVEWLNAFLRVLWGLANPEMFVPIADVVEDVMQQSLPGFIDAVRISDIGQGTNPFRIISMRALPDQPHDKEYPREEWVGLDKAQIEAKKAAEGKPGSKEADLDQTGDYVNYEVAFSYQALPGQGNKLRQKNIHLLLEFFIGAFDWLHIPIPIWVQVEGICGTVRLRIQFIPEAPFVRNLTFTLMGVPAVEVSVVPLASKLPNVLDLPFVSKFVKMAIAAGTAELVAPKSMTLNIQEMLSAAVVGDTNALGVFVIRIHHAKDLQAKDRNGFSDPYIVLAYAKFGKPLYSTRIILEDLNPVFEETAMMILTRNEVQADEDLSAMLWDSDKRSADDLLGRVQIPVKELMKRPNEMFDREDPLMGFENANKMEGKLVWSIGYFEKVPLNKKLERLPEHTEGAPVAAKPPKTAPEMEMLPGDKAPNPAAQDLPPPPPDVQRTPPDPEWPSGVLSIVVHQINNLERQNLRGTNGDREGQAGQDTDEPSEEGSNLPSAYCEIVVNDDLVYKTRVKQYSSMPFFEAGTEVFVRDWTKAVARIVVRDSRLRERDPILGIIDLPLKKILTDSSEVTTMYSLQEGVGFGRANITVLFKSVKLHLSRAELGWDTATVEIGNRPFELELHADHKHMPWAAKGTGISLSTTDSTEKLSKANANVDEASGKITWEFDMLRLPVYNRYASSLVVSFGGGGVIGGAPQAIAVISLKDFVDGEERIVEAEVITGKNLNRLRQHAFTDFTRATHQYTVVGTLRLAVNVDPGLDMDHEKNAKTQARRHAFEAYDHIEGEALIAEKNSHAEDDGVVDKQERKEINNAKKRQLENRQRGIAGYKPYRTMKWMGQGLKSRLLPSSSSTKREPAVKSEA